MDENTAKVPAPRIDRLYNCMEWNLAQAKLLRSYKHSQQRDVWRHEATANRLAGEIARMERGNV